MNNTIKFQGENSMKNEPEKGKKKVMKIKLDVKHESELPGTDAVNKEMEKASAKSKDYQEENAVTTHQSCSHADPGMMNAEPVNAENIRNATPVAIQATGTSAPQFGVPCPPSTLSAQTLFELALTVEFPDPARQRFGFFYEKHLKYECELLIPHPIPSYYRRGIWNALMIRRRNPDFFMCYAIDVVLTHYFNNFYPEDNDVFS